MECELCGKNSINLIEVSVDGVKLMACSKCSEPYLKKPVIQENQSPPKFVVKGKKIRNSVELKEFNRINLVSDWGKIIRRKREEQNLTVKELSEKLFEKESTISKIENEKTMPSNELIKKIENFFSINLIQKEENNFVQKEKNAEDNAGFTLMDFVKKKK
jgi:uncharacterized protein (TIGR00270 family)